MSGLRLSPRWVGRGLILVVRGDLWITREGVRQLLPSGGPRQIDTPQGRVTGYGSTDAGNTTGRLDGFTLPNSKAGPRSYFGHILARSLGGGGLGRVMQDSTNAGANNIGEEALYFISSKVNISKVGNTISSALQVGPTTLTPLNVWSTFGFSCNFVPGAAQNAADIVCYQNGVVQTNAVNSSPGRVYPENSVSRPVFGNRVSDSARTWDGQIGILAVFDATLTAAEQASLHANPGQLLGTSNQRGWYFVASGVTVYRPGSDIIVNGWTATPGGTLASCIDDPTLDRGDFITSPNLTDPATLGWQVPQPAGTWDFVVDADRTGASGQVRIVCLDAGGATVGTSAWQTLTATAASYTLSVTTSATAPNFRIEVQP